MPKLTAMTVEERARRIKCRQACRDSVLAATLDLHKGKLENRFDAVANVTTILICASTAPRIDS